MTGWRIGWMVVPQPLVRPIERLQGNLAISVPTLSQIAAEAAFDGRAELEAIKHGYEDNRKILIEGLPKAGLDEFLPVDGAFYLYADVSRFSDDSFDFRQAPAGGGARGGDAGRRFRSGQRPTLRPLLLRGLGRRHARGGGADRNVAQGFIRRAGGDHERGSCCHGPGRFRPRFRRCSASPPVSSTVSRFWPCSGCSWRRSRAVTYGSLPPLSSSRRVSRATPISRRQIQAARLIVSARASLSICSIVSRGSSS